MILVAVPLRVKMGWFLLWSQMGWVDIIFLIVFGAGIFIGLRSGLTKVLPRLFGVLGAQVVAIEYSKPLAEFLKDRIFVPAQILEIVLFPLFAIGSIILVRFLFQLLAFFATVDFKPPFNGVGGALVSGFQFLLLLGLVTSFLALFPVPFIQETFTADRSFSGPYLAQSSKEVHNFFVKWLPDVWRIKQDR